MKLLVLSKENLKLAKEEALSLLKPKKHKINNNLLILEEADISLAERLAYTRSIYDLLFEATKENLIKDIKNFNWQSIYKDNFCVRINSLDDASKGGGGGGWVGKAIKEKDLAGYIWNKLKNPKVNLENPKTLIQFFIIKDRIYAAKLVKEIKHDFESRKADKRPAGHPTAMNPKLARALVNLTGAKEEVMDPCCGAGGILIEAGLMGLNPIGYDLYGIMIKKAKINLDYYKIKNYKLAVQDTLKIKQKYDYIVTDLPYGMNTSVWVKKGDKNERIPLKKTDDKKRLQDLEKFYLEFLKNLKKIMKIKAVIIFPHYTNYKKLIKQSKLKIEKEFSQYVHRSLTRKIVVLS